MVQIVGHNCVICQERIGSALDSHFCPSCGNAVHSACATSSPKPPECCLACGSSVIERVPDQERNKRTESATAVDGNRHESKYTPFRYLVGVLLFLGIVFSTPIFTFGTIITHADGGGPPVEVYFCSAFAILSLLAFPGYFAFPYSRRFQAIAWLALACAGYTLLMVGMFGYLKSNQQMLPAKNREFLDVTTIHYERCAALCACLLVVWFKFVRRRRD